MTTLQLHKLHILLLRDAVRDLRSPARRRDAERLLVRLAMPRRVIH